MENQKTPPGNRITRLSFSLVTQQFSNGSTAYQVERREYALGVDTLRDDVLSLWCELTGDFMTITKVVAPLGSQTDLLKGGQDIIEWIKTTGPRREIKKGASNTPLEDLEAAECAEADKILLRMWNHVESMEQRRVTYKMSEITGPIEWTAYVPRTDMPKRLQSGGKDSAQSKSKRSAGKKNP